jgi:hypothetical protein
VTGRLRIQFFIYRGGDPSLDFEIIAQGEADEKHEDDRKGILPEHQPVIALACMIARRAISSTRLSR